MNGKQLKNSILQWAIQGKLVPQDASEEPAIELLKRINPKFVQPEYEGELPDGWSACKLKDCGVSILNGYAFKSNEYSSTGIRVIRITNVQDGNIVDDDPKFYSLEREIELEKYLLKENDLLMSLTGNVGRVGFLPFTLLPAALNQRVACLRFGKDSILNLYLFYFLQTYSFRTDCVKSGKGCAQLNISTEWLKNYIIPLPPLSEQKRIVEKIEELMPLVERYTKAQEGLDKLNGGIKEKLRASLLQEAIQGKLVPQDASEEPAIELLKRINPKFKPVEYEGELPEGWSVATLSTLCALIDGEKIQDKAMVNLDAKYLRGKNEGTILESGKYIPANSLVILVDGENSGEVFRTPIEGYQGSTFKRLTIDENMYEDFVLWVINSHRVKLREHKVGSAIPHLNKKLFRETVVLVPPLAEQKRIVAKIEELFAVLNNGSKKDSEV